MHTIILFVYTYVPVSFVFHSSNVLDLDCFKGSVTHIYQKGSDKQLIRHLDGYFED